MKLAFALMLAFASFAAGQTKPTQAEIDQWKKEPQVLESSVCKKVTWLLENERDASPEVQTVRHALGWWGRGFIEGAVFIMGDKAQKRASEFGLSIEVVAAHISAYCYQHPLETASDATQQLLVRVLK